MSLRGIFCVVLFSMYLVSGTAQRAEEVTFAEGKSAALGVRTKEDAGNTNMVGFDGQSNDTIFPGPIYLCYKDQFNVKNTGSIVVCDDPDDLTIPGIGYAYYKERPNLGITGPLISNIRADDGLEDSPLPMIFNGFYAYRDEINGDALFYNEGQIQRDFNSGNPEEMWFAPITFDDFAGNVVVESSNSIVNARPDQFFHVIYLNEVVISNKVIGTTDNPLVGSFQISGGVAEWDALQGTPSDYSDIGIYKVGDIRVRGSIERGDYKHGDVVNFTVPELGEYIIYVEDEKSCGTSMEANFNENDGSVTINVGSFTGVPGASECVSLCVEDFDDIVTMEFTISFDPNLLTFSALQNFNLFDLGESNFGFNSLSNGLIKFTWFDNSLMGQTLTNGECLFDMCFDVNNDAPIGACSDIAIVDSELQEIDSNFNESSIFNVIVNVGQACVDPGPTLTALINTCSSEPGSFSGALNFQIFGGTAPYSYVLSGGFSTPTGTSDLAGESNSIGNLPPGSAYVLTITDATNFMINLPVNIGSGTPLNVDLNGKDPSCFNGINGEIEADVSGGTAFLDGSYTYEWSNLVFDTNRIDALGLGNYSVTVTDANGCDVVASEFIGKDPINVSLDTTSLPTCLTSGDGVVTATITGGTSDASGDYEIRWLQPDKPTIIEMDDVDTNDELNGGPLTVYVVDAIGCQWSEQFTIEAEKELKARFRFDPTPICNEVTTVDLFIEGYFDDGQPFRIKNAMIEPGSGSPSSMSFAIFDLQQDTFDFEMFDDATGCKFDTTFIFELPDEGIVINSVPTPPTCNSSAGGTISVDPVGGIPEYAYSWDDGSTSKNRENLSEGTYLLTVTDALGCEALDTFILEQGTLITYFGIIVDPIDCDGVSMTGDLEANVDLNGSTATFNWDGPGGVSYSTALIEDVGPGEYILTIQDSNGCEVKDTANLAVGETFEYTTVSEPPACNTGADGELRILQDEVGDFSYEWDHPNNTGSEVLSNIGGGDYVVTITEVGGCTIIDTLTLLAPSGIAIDIQFRTAASCSDTSDGGATAIASGGVVDNGSYGFLWSSLEEQIISNVNPITTGTATMLGGGEQWVIVNDGRCFDQVFFTIDAPDTLVLDEPNSIINDISCFAADDGSATILAQGGSGTYVYSWVGANVDEASITDLSPGYHTYVLLDDNGCGPTIDSILVIEPDSLITEIDLVRTVALGCSNDEDAVIAVTVSGGDVTNDYTYEWTSDISTNNIANNLGPGEYDITVTDANGCVDSTNYTVMAPPPITADIPTPVDPVCFSDRTCIGLDEVFGGSGSGYRFSVNNGPLTDIDSCVRVFAGVYDIRIFDNTGCSFDTTLTIEQPEELILDLGSDIVVDLGDSSTVIDLTIEGPNDIADVFWDPVTGFGCLNDDCDRIVIFPATTTLYKVNVVDDQGCTAEDELLIEVVKVVRAYFPNAFSPNGDGANDIFNAFTGRGIKSIDQFAVYDRWGNRMYEVKNLSPNSGGTEGWDGRYNNSEVDPGVYSYFARVTLVDDEQVMVRGDVTLLR